MYSMHKQRGLSALGWLVVLSLAGFGFLVVSKLAPHYLDNRFVVSTLKSLSENPDLSRMTSNEIRNRLSKEFTINNVRGKASQSVKISPKAQGFYVDISYEERIPLIANVDVVLVFSSVLDTARPALCCSPPPDFLSAAKGKE